MTAHRPRSSTRKKVQRRRLLNRAVTALIATGCLAAAVAIAVGIRARTSTSDASAEASRNESDAMPAATDHAGPLRAIYRHSVVPGGVHDTKELRQAVVRDPIVAAHYGDLSLVDARIEHVEAPRQVYVSYRIGDRIYWTKRKVTLNAGEAIITDGTTEIRTRCGNGISTIPMSPTLAAEPPLEELDRAVTLPGEPPLAAGDPGAVIDGLPAMAALDLPIAPVTSALADDPAPLGFSLGGVGPLAIAQGDRNVPTSNETPADPSPDPLLPSDDPPSDPPGPPVDPPVSVPEPSSLLLVTTGLAAYALRRRGRG